jgi:hypothetical protein
MQQMLTYRSYSMRSEEFIDHISDICGKMRSSGIALTEQPVIEYAIFDTNISHDDDWINGE